MFEILKQLFNPDPNVLIINHTIKNSASCFKKLKEFGLDVTVNDYDDIPIINNPVCIGNCVFSTYRLRYNRYKFTKIKNNAIRIEHVYLI